MLANALSWGEVNSPFDTAPRGPHVREANYARSVFLHQWALADKRLSQRHFALKMLGVSWQAWTNWINGDRRLRSDSLEKLAKFAPSNLPRPLGLASDTAVDPEGGQTYDPRWNKPPSRGYSVRTNEGEILARWIDRISDEEERGKALADCIQRLSANPRGVVAEKRPDRPTTSKP